MDRPYHLLSPLQPGALATGAWRAPCFPLKAPDRITQLHERTQPLRDPHSVGARLALLHAPPFACAGSDRKSSRIHRGRHKRMRADLGACGSGGTAALGAAQGLSPPRGPCGRRRGGAAPGPAPGYGAPDFQRPHRIASCAGGKAGMGRPQTPPMRCALLESVHGTRVWFHCSSSPGCKKTHEGDIPSPSHESRSRSPPDCPAPHAGFPQWGRDTRAIPQEELILGDWSKIEL